MSQAFFRQFVDYPEGKFIVKSIPEMNSLIRDAQEFVESHAEFGMTELHPVIENSSDSNSIIVELEFMEDCECKHDLARCINDFNEVFKHYNKQK
jgi:hypothetical protein